MTGLGSLLLAFLTLFTFTRLVSAQVAASEQADDTNQKACRLLDNIADTLAILRTPGNRIQVAFVVADLLWERDEKRARSLFELVMREMAAVVASVDPSDQNSQNNLALITQQRRQILERIALHDPDLASAFLQATRSVSSKNPQANRDWEDERNLQLRLAELISVDDPVKALRIARAALPAGVTHNFVSLLTQLQQKDPKAAQAFYRELVDRLDDENSAQNQEMFNVGWNLVSSFQPPQAEEELHRKLVETLIGRTLAITPDTEHLQLAQNLYNQTRYFMPQIEKFAPARSARIRQWLQMVSRSFDVNSRMHNELNELSQSGTIEDVIGLAQRYPAEFKGQIHQQAVWKALNAGDFDRARQLVTQLISDPGQRQQMTAQIENQMIWKAINENRVGEARPLLNRVKAAEQRVQFLTQLASNLAAKGDKEGALALLDDARLFLISVSQNSTRLSAELQLVRMYCTLAPKKSVEYLQSLILQINQLVAAAAVLDGFEQRYLDDGEWNSHSYNTLSNLITNMDQVLGQLALESFDEATALAGQLERPEVRVMAQLAIVQATLNKDEELNLNGGTNIRYSVF